MCRLSATSHANGLPLFRAGAFSKSAGTLVLFVFFVLALVLTAHPYGLAQCDDCAAASPASILGEHRVGGRECASCHAPHNGSVVTVPGVAVAAGSTALWGTDATPSYGPLVPLGDPGSYVMAVPARAASSNEEVVGILLCLSCHDGNLTPQTMMASESYAHKMGFPNRAGRQPIPTLLGGDGALASGYSIDHPLGTDATITLSDGLGFANGIFSVIPGSPYARFMANYGLPVLMPGKRLVPYGVDLEGKPYVLCTTCHNQHLGAGYSSTATSPIVGDGGGRVYSTFFFANGPYNPKFDTAPSGRAPSTAQFCRQCHIDMANEGNNSFDIKTVFY
ncbi:MAG: hypothetical protein ABSD75_02385 [Terriglobales bacterium]|jgi:hypothetical protein